MAIQLTDQGYLTSGRKQLYGGGYDQLASQQGGLDQFLASLATQENANRYRGEDSAIAQNRWERQMGTDAERFAESQRQFDIQRGDQERRFNVGVDQAAGQRADQNYWRGIESATAAAERDAGRAVRAQEMNLQVGTQAADRARQMWESNLGRADRMTDRAEALGLDRARLGLQREELDLRKLNTVGEQKRMFEMLKNAEEDADLGSFATEVEVEVKYPGIFDAATKGYLARKGRERQMRLEGDYRQDDSIARALNERLDITPFKRAADTLGFEKAAALPEFSNPAFVKTGNRFGIWAPDADAARFNAAYTARAEQWPDPAKERNVIFENGRYRPIDPARPYFSGLSGAAQPAVSMVSVPMVNGYPAPRSVIEIQSLSSGTDFIDPRNGKIIRKP